MSHHVLQYGGRVVATIEVFDDGVTMTSLAQNATTEDIDFLLRAADEHIEHPHKANNPFYAINQRINQRHYH